MLTIYAAWRMNCLAGAFQMAGTVMTHLTSSLVILVSDWSVISCRAWSRKKRSAWQNTVMAGIALPFAARMVVSLFRFWWVRQRGKDKGNSIRKCNETDGQTNRLFIIAWRQKRSKLFCPNTNVWKKCKIKLYSGQLVSRWERCKLNLHFGSLQIYI